MYRTLIPCARYAGLAGSGLERGGGQADPPDKNFQSPVWGSSSTSGGELKGYLHPRQIKRWLGMTQGHQQHNHLIDRI